MATTATAAKTQLGASHLPRAMPGSGRVTISVSPAPSEASVGVATGDDTRLSLAAARGGGNCAGTPGLASVGAAD